MSEVVPHLQEGYAVLAELWCSPQDADLEDARRRAGAWLPDLHSVDPEAGGALARFLQHDIAEDEYISLFELDPRCALYVGSHTFEEPTTCAKAGVSDRNGYMIELLGIYRHLGLSPAGGELPDYLPMMVEFLALTAGSDDPVRDKLIREYLLPYLPPLRAKLEELHSPYQYLLDASARLMEREVAPTASGEGHA
ncbi:MAG: nitrate reductase molybdenum cofactor assembly chaperone [Gammaproteobacteria bacterium]|nr:nitrate reductase molybdenum cofactor assembly chaperone [Gammaproteobacteria bacterium]MBM5811700.1 nitrate reductase molybdenum cofactor assembly chaperone [Gammaproteobacteria bacterium]